MASYDDIAPGYNELHGAEQARKAQIIAQHLTTTKNDKILDVGCGTGLGSKFLHGAKTGIDTSHGLLRECPFPAVVGKAESLPFDDKSFDVTVCVTALHNFDDARKALAEMARVTKRELAVTILKKSPKATVLEAMVNDMLDVLTAIDDTHDKIFIAQPR